MNGKIGQSKGKLQKNQEDWASSFKQLEYQHLVLVTSGVLKTTLCFSLPSTYFANYVVVQILDNAGELFTTHGSCEAIKSVLP